MLSSSSRQQTSLNTRELSATSASAYKKYLEDDDENDFTISSISKRTRYSKLDDLDDKEADNYSIRSSSMRKYSSSSNASYLKDDPEQFYAELTSRTASNRLLNKRNNNQEDLDNFNLSRDDDDFKLTSSSSRYLSKQNTREDQNRFQLDDDHLSTTSSHHSRRQLSRLSSKEETGSTISSKPPSRFLSKYASREQVTQDDDDETAKYFTSPRKEFNSRFSSREELSKDDDLGNGRESLSSLKYKKYSREENNFSVLNERPLLPENNNRIERSEIRADKNDLNAFSSLSLKTSRMIKDLQDDQVKQQPTQLQQQSSSFFDKENQSKSYLEDENSVLDAKVCSNQFLKS